MPDITSIISYILLNYKKDEFDPSDLVKFLYKKKAEGNTALKNTYFDNDGIEPDSRQVYDSFSILMPGFIGAGSPGRLFIKDKKTCKMWYEKFYKPGLSEREISEIEKLSEEFSKLSN